MSEQINQEYIYELVVSRDGRAQFSAHSSGLYRFDGEHWQDILASLNADPFAVTAVTLSPNYNLDRTVFAGAAGVILRSMDAGEAWEAFALPAPPPVISALIVTPDYADTGTVYAATLEDGVFVSTDRGVRWEAWNFGLIGFSVNALLVERNGKLYAGTELGIFSSDNNGRSWSEIAVLDAPVMALAPSPDGFWVGTDGMGLWKVRHGTQKQVGSVDVTGTVETIITDDSGLLILCNNELLISRDQGATWNSATSESMVTAVNAPDGLASGRTVLIGVENGQIQTLNLP